MSTLRLMRQLIPVVGPEIRDRIWLIHYMPVDEKQSDFFRIFVNWEEMLDSMSLPIRDQHPAWNHPFEIFQVDFELCLVQEISEEVMRLVEIRRSNADRGLSE